MTLIAMGIGGWLCIAVMWRPMLFIYCNETYDGTAYFGEYFKELIEKQTDLTVEVRRWYVKYSTS